MNDRLGDLSVGSSSGSDDCSWVNEDVESDGRQIASKAGYGLKRKFKIKRKKSTSSKKAKNTTSMDAFFRDVELVKANIETITKATKRIAELNEAAMMATADVREAEISREMRPLVDATNRDAKRTKDLLALMNDGNKKLKQKKGKVKQSDIQIRENLYYTLTRKFVDELKSYQVSQQKYKADLKSKAKRQIQIIQPDATDEEIDIVVKSEGGKEGLYKKAILTDSVAISIKAAYSHVADKYRDILIIEQSVAELHQMFLDLALLTEQQGELHDHIEHHVKVAADYIAEGNLEMYKSIEEQKKLRKKHCIIIVVVGVVVAVITVLLLL